MHRQLQLKYSQLSDLIKQMNRIMVAYSGGIDSSLLLKIGTLQLGDKCTGVLAVSPSLAQNEYKSAVQLAQSMGARLLELHTDEMESSLYTQNDQKRCFYCKNELFQKMRQMAAEQKITYILDGTNFDDTVDYRPGRQAAEENQVRSPFVELEFTKEDIRIVAKSLGLPNWQKPAQPCLASRIAYGIKVQPEVLAKIDMAESYLKDRGFKIVRVRYLGDVVSIEVGIEELERLHDQVLKNDIFKRFKSIGFPNVKVDWDGFSSGKLNVLNHQIQ